MTHDGLEHVLGHATQWSDTSFSPMTQPMIPAMKSNLSAETGSLPLTIA